MTNFLNEASGKKEDLENQPENGQLGIGKTFADTLAIEDLDDEVSLDDLPV